MIIFIFLAVMTAHASDMKPVDNKVIKNYEKIYQQSGKGLDFVCIGKSMIEENKLKDKSSANLNILTPVKKAYLIWSGETDIKNTSQGNIRFITPDNKEHNVKASKIWKKDSTGVLYSAVSDVTKFVKKSGLYGVTGLASDPVNPYGKEKYSVAGWALVVVTQDASSSKNYNVFLMTGLEMTKPGEIHEVTLNRYLSKGLWKVMSIEMIGGHGRAGNGSGNLVNGVSLSGKDDWDGSSGDFWDVDLFVVDKLTLDIKKDGLLVSVDPLLQWVYPVAMVVRMRNE